MNLNSGNVAATAMPEAFSSLLERLSNVIAETQEQLSTGRKIHEVSYESVERLGFASLRGAEPTMNSKSDSAGEQVPQQKTSLQKLEELIMILGSTNTRFSSLNADNDRLRSALQNQL